MAQNAPTLVIGAGPAGLAVAACLKTRGVPFVILERGTEIAASWRRHYERLHLHTAARHSFLPGLPFPAGTPRYPSRDQMIGFGNSAGEIAIDLHEHGARAVMAVRSPVNIVPRDILGVPISSVSLLLSRVPSRVADALAPRVARLTTGDLARFGLRRAALSPWLKSGSNRAYRSSISARSS